MSDEKYPLFETRRDEELMFFSSGIQNQACIGYLRGDFGHGTKFYSTWCNQHEELKDQEFMSELDDVVNTLRKDGPLKDLPAMQRFCEKHSQAQMSPWSGSEYYGLRVDTDKHRYYLRLCPMKGNYTITQLKEIITDKTRYILFPDAVDVLEAHIAAGYGGYVPMNWR